MFWAGMGVRRAGRESESATIAKFINLRSGDLLSLSFARGSGAAASTFGERGATASKSELGVHLRRGWVEGYSAELSGRADKIVRRERAAKVRVCALRAHHDNLSPEMRAR